jgi:hypothetical protein
MRYYNLKRILILPLVAIVICPAVSLGADPVLDWNSTMRSVINDVPSKANPGLSTRAIGMMNAAIYDVYQSVDRTHQPFLAKHFSPAAGANLEAAVAQAAFDILQDCYLESGIQTTHYNNRINDIVGSGETPANINSGKALGAAIAAKYIHKHLNDGWDNPGTYAPTAGPGHWSTDPYFNENQGPVQMQSGWGPGWGDVKPWVMQSNDQFDSVLVDIEPVLDLTSPKYTAAYNQVINYGAKTVYGAANTLTSRSTDQTNIGKFWGYDVPSVGPPPVLFLKNLADIADQANNTPEQNARLFAMASVAMADAAIASWDVKFDTDFWRPVTAIIAGDSDTNPDTQGDSDWRPLGAPGHGIMDPDFTPPFPAYTSGHATMGGALFKTLQMFYGVNEWADIPGVSGTEFYLTSDELTGADGTRMFERFTEPDLDAMAASLDALSPEGENAISRIFLGIHWIFDATDGIRLGNAIAGYSAENHFLAVPEPTAASCLLVSTAILTSTARRRRPK